MIKIVTITDGRKTNLLDVASSDWTSRARVQRLIELGVELVICGGIDAWSADALQSAGITVDRSVKGDVDDVLKARLRGDHLEGHNSPEQSAKTTDKSSFPTRP